MSLSQAINKIKKNVNIVEVIENDTNLKKTSEHEFIGSCPFHRDVHPSFTVNDDLGVYHCFSCGRSGNVVQYYSEKNQISKVEAAFELGNMYNIDIALLLNQENVNEIDQQYLAILKLAQNYFEKTIWKNQTVIDELQKRQLSQNEITKFKIGYDDGNLVNELSNQGIPPSQLADYGLAKIDVEQQKVFDFFQNRITYPIYDEYNRLVAFSARARQKVKYSKYKNTKNNKYFKKQNIVYLLNEVDKAKPIYLFEGQNDAISGKIAGVQNSVASLGTSLTEMQAAKIANVSQKIIICYDDDDAGHKAIKKAAKLFQTVRPDIQISVCNDFDGFDPDEYRRKFGNQKLFEKLQTTIPIIGYLIQEVQNKNSNNNPTNQSHQYKQIIDLIAQFSSSKDEAILWLNKINQNYNLPEKNNVEKIKNAQEKYQKKKINKKQKQIKSISNEQVIDPVILQIGSYLKDNKLLAKKIFSDYQDLICCDNTLNLLFKVIIEEPTNQFQLLLFDKIQRTKCFLNEDTFAETFRNYLLKMQTELMQYFIANHS